MRRVWIVLCLTLGLALLVACGGGDTDSAAEPAAEEIPATPTPVAEPTPAPTATEEPTPVAQPESPLAMESPLAAPESPLAQPETDSTDSFVDPFAYCAAVGTIDAPDARYTGPDAPEAIAEGLRTVFDTPDTPLSFYQDTMVWRCMEGAVYACSVGANLPCHEQADLSDEPTEAMQDYCAENPDSDFIPMVVTGRATVYQWACVNGEPQAGDALMAVDPQGFLADFWYEIPAE